MEDPWKGDPVISHMYVYKNKIQYDGSIDKFRLRITAIGDLQIKDTIG